MVLSIPSKVLWLGSLGLHGEVSSDDQQLARHPLRDRM